jgi:hypothetical protein
VFKVMTWNVENLFRPGADAGPDTQAIYQAKLQGLAEMINSQAPDALSVQEIGDPAALADLIALLKDTWHQRVSAHPDQRHIRVAWFTDGGLAVDAEHVEDHQRRRNRGAALQHALAEKREVRLAVIA